MGASAWSGRRRFAEVRRSLIVTAVTLAVVAVMPALSKVAVHAAGSTGDGVSYTLEGCRASINAYLPGTFICPDAQYTTGNLGGGWNEFDLVPGRVTLTTSNSATSPQSFSFDVTVDTCSTSGHPCTGVPGYDQLSTLTYNGAKSSGTCDTNPSVSSPGFVTDQLFRQVDISGMTKSSKCVYDFYARLAIGSHGYPGSSLHYHLNNITHGTQGIGNKDVSIPVKPIAPFVFTKQETAVQGSSAVWTVSKEIHGTANFTDTCLDTTGKDVTVDVSWDKTVTDGDITVTGAITLTNTAHRSFDVNVSDQLYDGTDQSSPDGSPKTKSFTPIGAGDTEVYSDVWSPPDNVDTSYNDIASGTLTDPIFGDTVDLPDATANATVKTNPPDTGDSAVITDVEALTDGSDPTSTTPATDFTFTVTDVSGASGTLYSTYDPSDSSKNVVYDGSDTTGPLTWVSDSQKDDGSVEFSKTINVTQPTIEEATLHDTATIAPDGQSTSSFDASLDVTAGATVEIDVNKTTTIAQQQDATFTFNAYAPGQDPSTPPNDQIAGTVDVTIPGGTIGPVQPDPAITGLDPNTKYLIDEPAVAPFPPNSQSDVEVDLPSCSTEVFFVNTAAPATAQVQKITDPLGSTSWDFTLTGDLNGTAVDDLAGPDPTAETVTVTANDPAGYTPFLSNLDVDGATYTITETQVTHWDPKTVIGDVDGSSVPVSTAVGPPTTCSFVWTLADFSGSLFECTFTNVEESDVTVVKTQDGAAPTDQFPFRLCPGTSLSACGGNNPPAGSTTLKTNDGENPVGTLDFGYFKPGDYVLCELAVPAGWHSTLQDPPYNGTLDAGTGNVCLTFTLGAGDDKTFTVDNSSPKGNALTIGYWKHWNSINVGHSIGAGNKLMDDFLPISLGPYVVDTAQKGVNVLSVPSMKYAENGLAAQLLAAKLNVASGALTCTAITNAITQADGLLNSLTNPTYNGPPSSRVGNKYPGRATWVSTASTLNAYNNNLLC